jgi:adenylylsulfate kinase
LIPRYAEIYLKCPLEECMHREEQREQSHGAPRAIYKKGEQGSPVPGVNAPYEEPLAPDVTIDTGKTTVRDAVELICRKIF